MDIQMRPAKTYMHTNLYYTMTQQAVNYNSTQQSINYNNIVS